MTRDKSQESKQNKYIYIYTISQDLFDIKNQIFNYKFIQKNPYFLYVTTNYLISTRNVFMNIRDDKI